MDVDGGDMTARGDRKGLCLFDSDMPLRQRSELIGATITAIGRSFAVSSPLEPKSPVGRAGTPDVAFVVTRSHYYIRALPHFSRMEICGVDNQGPVELTQVMMLDAP